MKQSLQIVLVLLMLVLIGPLTGEAVAGPADDAARVSVLRHGMQALRSGLERQPQLLADDGLLPQLEQRRQLRQVWVALLDHVIAFDTLNAELFERYHDASSDERRAAFRIAYAGFLAQYRQTLDLLDLLERNPSVHALLNEAVPELGLPAGTYARIKFRFLNLLLGADFARLDLMYGFIRPDAELAVTPGLEDDRQALWQAGSGKGAQRTAENGMKIIADAFASGWYPLQKGVAEWMGDTKVWRPQINLIDAGQIAELQRRLQPGDILLIRREWYLSNIGLPGYWPHAALYVGNAAERRAYFDDPQTRAWLGTRSVPEGDLEQLLQETAPAAYVEAATPHADGHLPRVIEAISEGVSLTTLEHAAAGDSLVVLRPNLPKAVKARAISRAFHYAGRPYDFEFDFRTDASLVCTELVFKGYEADALLPGLALPVSEVLGRPVVPANEFARLFDAEYDRADRQFELVAFLDGRERLGRAEWSDLGAFRQSWKRPKWHLLLPAAD